MIQQFQGGYELRDGDLVVFDFTVRPGCKPLFSGLRFPVSRATEEASIYFGWEFEGCMMSG